MACAARMLRLFLGIHQGSVRGSWLFILHTNDLSTILGNTLMDCAGDSTLLAEVSKPCNQSTMQLYHLLIVVLFILVINVNAGKCIKIVLKLIF